MCPLSSHPLQPNKNSFEPENGLKKDQIPFVLKDALVMYLFLVRPLFALNLNLCLTFAWCIGHICAKAAAPDIKQWSYFLSPKKGVGGRCLKSLQLKSYKSALAVVLQNNLCKAMAPLPLNRFAVVGWFSDEEQLSSIRDVFLSERSPPPHHTCPAPVGGGFW